ncbi:hypothetical protein ACQLT9_006070, partial [Salmonella enterica subsp. diarizonae]
LVTCGSPDGSDVYYVLPGVFRDEVIPGKEPVQAARVLHEAGVLWKKDKRSYQSLTPRIGGKQYRTYALMLVPVSDDPEEETEPGMDLI